MSTNSPKFIAHSRWLLFIFLALSFVIFGNSLGGDFIFDDRSVIIGNPLVERVSGIAEAFISSYHYARPQSGLYRPLSLVSYNLNWQASPDPFYFHVVNIALNGVVGYLIFLIVSFLKERKTAIIAAVFFLFLPIHVEAVASIVGRAELLMALFFLMALYAGLKDRFAWASLFFLLALFSKETGISFIPVFVFLELFWKKKNTRAVFKNSLFFLLPILIYAFLRYKALGLEYFIGTNAYSFFNPIKTADFFPGLWTAFRVLYLYIQKIVFPTYFSSDYSYNQIPVISDLWRSWQAIAGLGIFGISICLAVAKRNNLVGLGAFIFLSSYFVISNWVFKTGTIMAERLMYMPSLGLVILASVWINDYLLSGSRFYVLSFKRKEPKLIAYSLLLIATLSWYSYVIIDRNRDWLNEKNLFESAYAVAPNSVVNISNKASILLRESRFEEALEKINLALEIEPRNSTALHLAGQIYTNMGDKKAAEIKWKEALAVQSDYLYPYLSLGALYYKEGNFIEGERVSAEANKMYSTPNVIMLLALNKIGLKKYSEAVVLIEESHGRRPRELELRYVLGVAYFRDGSEKTARDLLLDLKDPGISEKEFFDLIKNTEIYQIEI